MTDEVLYNYLQNQCTDEEYKAVNNWLEEDLSNQKHLFLLEELMQLGRLQHFSSAEYLQKAQAKLEEKTHNQNKPTLSLSLRSWMGYAAMAAVVISLIAVGLHFFPNTKTLYVKEYVVKTDSVVMSLVLPDGTKVWLNKYSQLTYPQEFSRKQRPVTVEGEAYFEVAHLPEAPFIVQLDEVQVKVLGTSFNIKHNKELGSIETSLVSGRVELITCSDKGRVVLFPGQRADFNRLSGKLYVVHTNTKLAAVWHNELIPFENASLGEIFNALEELYDLTIVIAPNVDSCTYSGVVHKEDSILTVLERMKNTLPISYKIVDSKVFINPALR